MATGGALHLTTSPEPSASYQLLTEQRPSRRSVTAMWMATSEEEEAVSTVTEGPLRFRWYEIRFAASARLPPAPAESPRSSFGDGRAARREAYSCQHEQRPSKQAPRRRARHRQ